MTKFRIVTQASRASNITTRGASTPRRGQLFISIKISDDALR